MTNVCGVFSTLTHRVPHSQPSAPPRRATASHRLSMARSTTLREWLGEGPFSLALSSSWLGLFCHAGVVCALVESGLAPAKICGSSGPKKRCCCLATLEVLSWQGSSSISGNPPSSRDIAVCVSPVKTLKPIGSR